MLLRRKASDPPRFISRSRAPLTDIPRYMPKMMNASLAQRPASRLHPIVADLNGFGASLYLYTEREASNLECQLGGANLPPLSMLGLHRRLGAISLPPTPITNEMSFWGVRLLSSQVTTKSAALSAAQLPLLGSNQDSSDPESDVLPVTPRGSACLIGRTPKLAAPTGSGNSDSHSPKRS